MGATIYPLDDRRLQVSWNIIRVLIAQVCYRFNIPKKVQGSCRAAAWKSTWVPTAAGRIREQDVMAAQSDGTNHSEELLLAQIHAAYGSPDFDHMYVDISPCTGKWGGHHCQSLLSNGGSVKIGGAPAVAIPEPAGGLVWFALNEDAYEKGDLKHFRDQGTPGDQYRVIATSYAKQAPF